jgi:hypothetical protein
VIGPRLQSTELSGGTASGELASQLVAARHVHAHLAPDDIRDVKLIVLLIEVESGRLSGRFSVPTLLPYSADVLGRIAALGGVSRNRVSRAITRLLEAGALIVRESPDPCLLFVERVLQPAGAAAYLDWPSVVDRIRGHAPALLVLRSLVDRLRMPWEWTSVTYQDLGELSCYSLGMVRHGTDQLLDAGVLERRAHAGRGHEYRCSAWALGRGTEEISPTPSGRGVDTVLQPRATPASQKLQEKESHSGSAVVSGLAASAPGETTVEIGDLVVRVPAGTLIRMQATPDGAIVYHVGPHLRLTHRPAS